MEVEVTRYVQAAAADIASFARSTPLVDSDDLAQEAAIVVLTVLTRFPSSSDAYIRRSIRNRLVDVYRKAMRQVSVCSLDACAEALESSVDDLYPSPYAVDPLAWLVLKETLIEELRIA